jgi:hypothetical protein
MMTLLADVGGGGVQFKQQQKCMTFFNYLLPRLVEK